MLTPYAVGWDRADRLWVANGHDQRYSVFEADGTLLKTATRPVRGNNRLMSTLVFDADGGHFWDEKGGPFAPKFLLLDTAGQVRDSTPTVPHDPFPEAVLGAPLTAGSALRTLVELDFLPQTRWALAPDGRHWTVNLGVPRAIQTDREGDTLTIAWLGHRGPNLTWADRVLIWRAKRESNAQGGWFSRPLFQDIYLAPDGHVLLLAVDDVVRGAQEIDVLNPTGTFLGSFRLPVRVDRGSTMSFWGQRMALVTRSAEGTPLIVSGRIVRGGRGSR